MTTKCISVPNYNRIIDKLTKEIETATSVIYFVKKQLSEIELKKLGETYIEAEKALVDYRKSYEDPIKLEMSAADKENEDLSEKLEKVNAKLVGCSIQSNFFEIEKVKNEKTQIENEIAFKDAEIIELQVRKQANELTIQKQTAESDLQSVTERSKLFKSDLEPIDSITTEVMQRRKEFLEKNVWQPSAT